MDGFCSFKGCAALLRRGAKRWRDFSLGVCRIYRKAVKGLSPGWRLCGTLGARYQKGNSSEGAEDSLQAPGYRAVGPTKMTLTCKASFRPFRAVRV
jgi:hypothetical protein